MKKVVIAVSVMTIAAAAILAGCISTSVTVPVQVNEGRATNVADVVTSENRATQSTQTDGVEQKQGWDEGDRQSSGQ